MNQSDPASSAANVQALLNERRRARQRRLVLLSFGIPLFLLAVGFVFTLTRGVGLTVLPEDAAAEAEVSVTQGFGIAIGSDVYAISNEVVVAVASPGFYAQTVNVAPDTASSYLEVTLAPKPASLQLQVDVGAADGARTSWRIDDERVHRGSQLQTELPAGTYQLLIEHPFFETSSQTLTLQRDQQLQAEYTLTPVNGTLQIRSQPTQAQVWIDGQLQGQSDVELNLPGGEYRVELRLDDHAPLNDLIQITRQQSAVTRNYQLLTNPAVIDLTLATSQGQLTLNGRALTARSQQLQVAADETHVLSYRRPGFHPQVERIRLAPGETLRKTLTLRENIGQVVVRSTPSAAVWVNGKNMGATPLNLSLPAVPQQFELRRAGYHTHQQQLVPDDANEQLVSVNLQTELAYRLANMPGEFVNAAGVTMKRFLPNETFVLGAPRSEVGQRANELLREVQLTKPFYVSTTEITNAQFARFSKTSAGAPNQPRTQVSWEQAATYSNWLSAQEGLTPVYQLSNGRVVGADIRADGYRLPTEAEWEWLARKAGRRDLQRFVWGDDYTVPSGAGNFADELAKAQTTFYVPQYNDGFAAVAPVASFAADRNGLFDLAGNVSEWVHDHYTIEPLIGEANPAGPSVGEGHVIKGSSWRSGNASELRASYRDGAVQPRDDLGFRVVRYVYGEE